MSSLHRRFPCWLNDGEPGVLHSCTLSMHFTTARPLEVRLRLPVHWIDPDYQLGSGTTYARWSFDRDLLKASVLVRGQRFGDGDVAAGCIASWLVRLRRGGREIVVGTQTMWVRQFVQDVDRLSPGKPTVDVDRWIDGLLGTR